jgi:hypothetical protein
MQQFPNDKNLPIEKLAACFNNTSATYKFYWLLSIVDALESRTKTESTMIPKKELFARMISNAWYTVNYFHVSFGVQDKLQSAIETIKISEGLTIDANKNDIIKKLLNTENYITKRALVQFNNNVPHWFLSPWFPGEDKASIYKKSNQSPFYCPYALHTDFIDVDILWANYFLLNAAFIRDFCYWNLSLFLQVKNPNVPDIPNKLIKPASRNNLTKQRKFWDIVIDELGTVNCVYTKRELTKGDFAVEHFVPYNFVSHDLMWNLIPADKSFNSSKSDKLPMFNKYFEPYFDIQIQGLKIVREKQPGNKSLEDYLSIHTDIENAEVGVLKEKFKNTIQPLITIAANNGFEYLK